MASLYPAALDTNDTLYVAVNGLKSKLTADTDSNASTLFLTVPVGVPSSGFVTIKGEAIHYTNKTTTTLTGCTRGQDGTAKAAHFLNDEVDFGPVADHHNVLVQAIEALETKVGAGTLGIDGSKLKLGSIPTDRLLTDPGTATVSYKVRAYRNGAQTIPAGVSTKINIDTLTGTDPSVMYDSVNKKIICKKAGTYIVLFSLTMASGGANADILSAVYKNGAQVISGTRLTSTVSQNYVLIGADSLELAVNDYLELYGYGNPFSHALLAGFSYANFISVALLP